MKPSMFGRERRERLLNDGVCSEGNVLALSTVNKGIKKSSACHTKNLVSHPERAKVMLISRTAVSISNLPQELFHANFNSSMNHQW